MSAKERRIEIFYKKMLFLDFAIQKIKEYLFINFFYAEGVLQTIRILN